MHAMQCNATYRAREEGIEYSVIKLEGDPHATDAVRVRSYSQAPVAALTPR
ncbi:MAG: hypothetical protein WAW17_01300 [Rhodococcus sp. (in: high G+C Gram-positive bacteria)]|uniref:hypothetical protein n=1 Tax=Rhodococcus sp. TaxID=1831 RepID=UPI003BAF890C